MKKLLKYCSLLLLITLSQSAMSFSFKIPKLQRVAVEEVEDDRNVVAFETNDGQIVFFAQIKRLWGKRKNLWQVLKRKTINLYNGEQFLPEDITHVHVVEFKSSDFSGSGGGFDFDDEIIMPFDDDE